MKETISIVVPIKTNNKRLPGKNTKILNGKPLYSYLFDTLKEIDEIDNIFIDSSDPAIWRIANEYHFNILKRPEYLNSDNTAGNDLIQNILDKVKSDIIGQLHVTTPFLKYNTIKSAIHLINSDKSIDSVVGVVERFNRYWYNGEPVNHDIKNLIRTQDLIPLFEESPDMYFFRCSSFLKYKNRVCGKIKFLTIDPLEALDIDTIHDFQLAEAYLKLGYV